MIIYLRRQRSDPSQSPCCISIEGALKTRQHFRPRPLRASFLIIIKLSRIGAGAVRIKFGRRNSPLVRHHFKFCSFFSPPPLSLFLSPSLPLAPSFLPPLRTRFPMVTGSIDYTARPRARALAGRKRRKTSFADTITEASFKARNLC